MKIEAIGCEIYTLDAKTGKTLKHKPGEPFDADDKEAERLISLSKAKKAGKDTASLPSPPEQVSNQGGDK